MSTTDPDLHDGDDIDTGIDVFARGAVAAGLAREKSYRPLGTVSTGPLRPSTSYTTSTTNECRLLSLLAETKVARAAQTAADKDVRMNRSWYLASLSR